MQYTGLAKKYSINRRLTDRERERQLKQKARLEVEPAYQLSVIRLNSTYVELVDKYFAWKGFLTTFAIIAAAMMSYFAIGSLFITPVTESETTEELFFALGVLVIVAPLLFFLYWMFRKEAFAWTHYPIRLNRKTRMVHVFRTDGTVLSVPWDEIFFCIARLPQADYEIQGHVLDADGVAVKETFAFAMLTGSEKESELLKQHWEFLRRYMEGENLAPIYEHARYVLPIADKRESFKLGFHRTHADVGAVPLPFQAMILLIYLISYPGRWLAMRTSKLPVWPDEIEAQCRIDPDDPYVRDANDNPIDLR